MVVSLIVAMGRNGVIGREGELPWHLPSDLRRFRGITLGKPVIMGRKTRESIKRPLPGRKNIVLTRQRGYRAAGCDIAHTTDEALRLARAAGADEAVVIGGGEIYEAFLPLAERLYVSRVEGGFAGDAYFPAGFLDDPSWEEVHREFVPADSKNPHDHTFTVYRRAKMAEDDFLAPDRLIDEFSAALYRGAGVLFVGSGISLGSAVAGWSALIGPLAKSRIGLDVDESDDLAEIAQFVVNRGGGNRGALVHHLTEKLNREFEPNPYHQAISWMNIGTIWTTNYDTLLEKTFASDMVEVKANDGAISRGAPAYRVEIIKMHGCIRTSPHEDLVVTREDYEDYPIRRPATTQRLQSELLGKSFLFVGYSYKDPNIKNIVTEARRLSNKATRRHYIVLRREGEPQKARRQALWCEDLRRVGIESVLIEGYDQLLTILKQIARKSRGRTVFVTGSHKGAMDDVRKFQEELGRLLACDDGDDSKQLVLIDGQSSGASHNVVSAFSTAIVQNKMDIRGRLQIFPNPYAANRGFSDDPSLIPLLKKWRLPLFRSTHVVIAFDGAMGTKAEVELAHELGCHIIPVPINDGDELALKLLSEDRGLKGIRENLDRGYLEAAESLRLTPGDVVACARRLLDQ